MGTYSNAASWAVAVGHGATALNYSCALNGIVTSQYQFVAGRTEAPINNVYFGKGVTHATPTSYTINGTGGSGTNIAGASICIAGGQGTGTGAGGSFKVQVAPAGASGSSANALVDALTIDSTKLATFGGNIVVTSTSGSYAATFNGTTANLYGTNGTTSWSLVTGTAWGGSLATSVGLGSYGGPLLLAGQNGYAQVSVFSTSVALGAHHAPSGTTVSIQATNATTIGQVIKLAASHTANAFEVQDNAGAIVTNVTAAGSVFSNGPATSTSRAIGLTSTGFAHGVTAYSWDTNSYAGLSASHATYGGAVVYGVSNDVNIGAAFKLYAVSKTDRTIAHAIFMAGRANGTTLQTTTDSTAKLFSFRSGVSTEVLGITPSGIDIVGTTNTGKLIIASPTVPASAADTGITGTVCWDSNYVYVCTATDTWKRAAIATW